MSLTTKLLAAPLFVCGILTIGCGGKPALSPEVAPDYSTVVATADSGIVITLGDLHDRLVLTDLFSAGGLVSTDDLGPVLDSILADTLLGLEANEVRVEDDPGNFRLFRAQWYQTLIRNYLHERVYSRITVDSAELAAFYFSRPDLFSAPERIHLYHILIDTFEIKRGPEGEPFRKFFDADLMAETGKYAWKLREMISTPEDFQNVARQYSHDTLHGHNGGLIGWATRNVYHDPFDSIAFSLAPNEISQPYHDKYSWHIIYYDKRLPEGIPELDSVTLPVADNTLRTMRANELGARLIDSLMAAAVVRYNEPVLDSNVFLLDGSTWIAIVNERDTIVASYARDPELIARRQLNIENTKPDQKKAMLETEIRRLALVQAAFDSGIDTLPMSTTYYRAKYHDYARAIIRERPHEQSWFPPDSLVAEYYQGHIKEFQVDKPLVIQQIIVDDSSFAEFLRDQANAGADFLELAEQYYPGDPSVRRELADLGAIGPEDISADLFEAIGSVREGEVTRPIKTDFGYHIAKLVKRIPVLSLEQARSRIVRTLKSQHSQKVFEKFCDTVFKKYNVAFPNNLVPLRLPPLQERKSRSNAGTNNPDDSAT